jgi:ABC-2 type transport system ATP-binding protein
MPSQRGWPKISGVTGNAVEVHDLKKTYRRGFRRGSRMALDGLDLVVPEGEVHGFLGPNGSGKTTTLRVLTGLIHSDAGTVRLFGKGVPDHLPEVVNEVGAVVESPRFFPPFSGRLNLSLLARTAGFDEDRVDEALDTVGLTGRENDRVGSYSLGMRQRLGIAAALLKRPRLLVLDEPTNGLDPIGMRDVRTLMVRLAETGVTVLLSSHLLHEVQQVCSSVTIVSHGRAVRAGPVADVLAGTSAAGGEKVRVTLANPQAAADVLSAAGLDVDLEEGSCLVRGAPSGRVNQLLGERGIWADEITTDQAGLEDVFLALIEDAGADRAPGTLAPVDPTDSQEPPR